MNRSLQGKRANLRVDSLYSKGVNVPYKDWPGWIDDQFDSN